MRDRLINIIDRCNIPAIKQRWILELANESDIECAENQCDGCKIATDCISTLQGGLN